MKQALLSIICGLSIITSLTATDYYWIGGTGNWSDISHWATTSGGFITHDQVPTANDNVYFDANSFTGPGQTVTINNENIFCGNMDWAGATGVPLFQGDTAKVINVFGSLNFIENMILDYSGEVRFRAAGTDTPVETAGHHLGHSVLFVGEGGWILQDSIVVDSLIEVNDGNLNTNDYNLEADFLHIHIQNSGSLILGNSKITLHGRNLYYHVGDNLFADFVLEVKVMNVPFAINPGNALIEFTSDDVVLEVKSTTPLQLNDVYFSNNEGSGAMSHSYESVAYGEVRFNNDGRIDDDMSADHLILAPGKTYRFLSGYTYSLQQITANGDCLGTITIEGTEADNQSAVFYSDGQDIELDFVNLKNIAATGTSNYTANNAADLGNNTGWTINPRSVTNLYWVGGTGDWNDPNHWSLTSGGPGGACIPSGTDNVFFDANSFSGPGQTVTIDVANAYCRDIIWTTANFTPALVGDFDPILHIFGSMTQIEQMNYWFGGLISFEGQEPGKTIATGNHQLNKIEFLGDGSEWVLQDSLKSETYIFLTAGTLRTNDQYVESTEFFSGNSTAFRNLILGNSTWVIKHFPGALKDRWNVDLGGTFVLDAGTSTIDFRGIGGHLEHFAPTTTNIAYHRIIFNNEVGFLRNLSPDVNCSIDSLVFNHGGYFLDDFTVNTLILSPGFTYLIKENTTQTIEEIVSPGNCNTLITIRSDATGNPAFVDVSNDLQNLQYLSLRDLHQIGTGSLLAQNSIDLGNNQGWTIEELGSRTLYWVGGTGNWGDQSHWSLSSGGSGGECVPTLRDDVIFDSNSFSAPGQEVQGQELNAYYCRNVTWEDGIPNPIFNLNRLYCHGSAVFSTNMTNQVQHFHMSGMNLQNTRFNGQAFQNVYIDGDGSYTFLDDLEAEQLILRSGSLNTNGQFLTLGRLLMENEHTAFHLELGSSSIMITEPGQLGFFEIYSLETPFGSNTTINPGTSVIELTHSEAGARFSGGIVLNNVVFSGTDGQLNICHQENSSSINNPAYFNLLEIGGDAIIKGYHNIDSLLLAPGKSYRLEYDVTQTVNDYLLVLGNNCNPIELFSTLPGVPATIASANAEVIGDFIQMQDQVATGGATFYAGTHSTDIGGSNQGWLFESSPEYIDEGFFGPDQTLCEGESLTLSAYNFSLGETYEWSTGSTEATISITQTDTYWARVTFGNMCEIIDTIEIVTIEPAFVELGPDTSFCEGESLLLDATANGQIVNYTWQDGSMDPTFEVTQSGTYAVELNKEGCLSTDTILVELLEAPEVSLDGDQSLCEGESLTLDASIGQPATYEWQDGSSQATFVATQSGTYTVAVTANGCTSQDEATILFNTIPVFTLGPDTSLCTGETLALDLTGIGDTYAWQDNTTSPNFTIDESGQYWLEVTASGCVFADTLEVIFFETPVVDLGGDQSLCEGESLTLNADIGQPATYEWQDGSSQATFVINQSGDYSVMVTANGCTGQDGVSVFFNPIPTFSLGPDTSLCSGETLVFNLSNIGDTFLWQDGSNSSEYTIDQIGQFWLEVTANNCAFSDTITVDFQPSPEVDLGLDQMACEGTSITLKSSISANDTFFWQDGSSNAVFEVTQSGIYWLEAILGECRRRDSVAVEFQLPVDLALPDSLTLCSGDRLVLQPKLPPNAIVEWQDGSNNLEYTVSEVGFFSLVVDDGFCISMDTVAVVSSSCGEISVYIPNAFSPNEDGFNDLFEIYFDPNYLILDFQLKVFDRWGSLVFSSMNQEDKWDGTIQGQSGSFGVYVYMLQFTFEDQGAVFQQLISGDVTLMR